MIVINNSPTRTTSADFKLFKNWSDDSYSLNKAIPVSDKYRLKLFHYNFKKSAYTAVNMRGFQIDNPNKIKDYFIDPDLAATASFDIKLAAGEKNFLYNIFDAELLKIRKQYLLNIGYHYVSRRSKNRVEAPFTSQYARERYYLGIVDDKNRLVSNLVKYKHSTGEYSE